MEPEQASAASAVSSQSAGSQLKQMMAQVEKQVDALLEDTRRIQAERDNLLGTLLILQNDENVQSLNESKCYTRLVEINGAWRVG